MIFSETSTLTLAASFTKGTRTIATLALDNDFGPSWTHSSNNLVLSLMRKLTTTSELIVNARSRGAFRLSLLFGHVFHLLLEFFLLSLDQMLRVSNIFTLIEILMPTLEAFHHMSAFICTARLVHQFRIFALATLLQR